MFESEATVTKAYNLCNFGAEVGAFSSDRSPGWFLPSFSLIGTSVNYGRSSPATVLFSYSVDKYTNYFIISFRLTALLSGSLPA